MTALNKQALREAAEKATQGQWVVEFDDEVYSTNGVNNEQIAMVFSENEARDAAFIAAANPSTVLALLDELEATEKRIAEQNFENRLLANADRDIKALRQRIAELESRTVTLPPRAPENMAACLDGYDKLVIATTFRDTWNACLSEVMRMNAAGIGVKGE